GDQSRRSGNPDVRGRRDPPALPPLANGRRSLGLGGNALALGTDRAVHRESALGGHLLDRRVVADDRDALAKTGRVVAKQLEVEAALPDARAHRQDEHRLVAVKTAKALDELGDLLFRLDVNRVRCHGVYESPEELLRLL